MFARCSNDCKRSYFSCRRLAIPFIGVISTAPIRVASEAVVFYLYSSSCVFCLNPADRLSGAVRDIRLI